jgi:LCP family protein required for cell wall assembly
VTDSSNSDPRRVFIPPPGGGNGNGRDRVPPPPAGRRSPAGGSPRQSATALRGPMAPRRERGPSGPPRRRPGHPGGTPPGGSPRGQGRPWWKRLRWKRILIALPIIPLILLIGGYWWANSIFNRIERVEVSDVLMASSGGGTNYLIVGSDSREVLDPNDPEVDQDIEAPPGGQRADTMMVLRFEGGKAKIMSIPRDLWVTRADNNQRGKINGSYNGGPKSLIKTIEDNLDIPIQRYMEVDFVSFAGLVDALGGITINFEHPAFDTNSGLNITETGPVKLNGEQALSYVRSRHYTEIIDGEEVKDPRADLGRIERQQAFLSTVFAKLGKSASNPFTMGRVASKMADGLRIDDDMTLWDAITLGRKMKGLSPIPVELPTESDGNGLALIEAEAPAALDQFR